MKTKEEIEQLAEKFYNKSTSNFEIYLFHIGFIDGYTQCQEDMANKKYTEEDIKKAYNEGYRDAEAHSIEFPYKDGNVDNRDISEFNNAEYYINSLNKQD